MTISTRPLFGAALCLALLTLPLPLQAGLKGVAPTPMANAKPLAGEVTVATLAQSRDGKALVVGVSADKVHQLWRINLRRAEESQVLLDSAAGSNALAFSPDGTRLAVGNDRGEVKVVSYPHGAPHTGPTGNATGGTQLSAYVTALAFSPDGETLAIASAEEFVSMPSWEDFKKGVRSRPAQPSLKVWSFRRGAYLFEQMVGSVEELAFDPSGARLSFKTTKDGTTVLDAATGAKLSGPLGAPPSRAPGLEFVERLNLLKLKEPGTEKLRCLIRGRDARLREPTLSEDGGEIFLIGSDGVVRGFDTGSCEELHVLAPWKSANPTVVIQTSAGAATLSFSPDGQRLAVANQLGTVALWDTQTGLVSRLLRGRGERIVHLAFEYAGGRLFAGSEGGWVFEYDTFSGKMLSSYDPADYGKMFGPPGAVTMTTASPDGRFMAWGNEDGNIRIYEPYAEFGKTFMRMVPGDSPVRGAAFDPTGDVLVTVSDEGIRAVDTKTLKDRWVAKLSTRPELTGARSVAASSDGQTLAVGVGGGVALLSLETGALLGKLPGEAGKVVAFLSFHPAGTRLAVVTEPQTVVLFDAQKRKLLRKLPARREPVTALGFSPDRKVLAVASATAVELLSVDEGAPLRRLAGRARPQDVLAFQPEGALFASTGPDGRVRVWDLATAKLDRTLVPEAGAAPVQLALSFDGTRLALGRGDGAVEVWSVREEKRLGVVKLAAPVAMLRFDREGGQLVAGGGKEVVLVRARDGEEMIRVRAPAAFTVGAITLDGQRGVTAGEDGLVRLWDFGSGEVLKELQGGPSPSALALSPDETMVALATATPKRKVPTRVELWDLSKGTLHKAFTEHSERVNSLAFSPDSKQLTSASGNPDSVKLPPGAAPDRSVRGWYTGSGDPLLTPNLHEAAMLAVAFRPGHEALAVAMSDGQIEFIPMAKGVSRLTLLAVGDDDWAIVTAAGEYAASRAAASGMGFRVGNRVFPFDQYDLQLNRPDQVAAALGLAAESSLESMRKAHASRVRRMGLSEAALGHPFELPQVRVDREKLPLTTAAKELTFSLSAYDGRGGLDRLMVFVNDVPVHGRAGQPVANRGESRLRQDVTVPLSAGKNVFQVSALNVDGAESLRETFEVTRTSKPSPTLYLLAVGVAKYREPLETLEYPVKDARDLAAHFRKQSGRFGKVEVKELVDADVTRAGFAEGKEFLKRSGVDDIAVVFLAGHGLRDDKGDYYFATSDIDSEHPEVAGLSQDALGDVFEGVQARRRLLLMDTCLSGELDEDTPAAVTEAPDLGPGVKVRLRGAKIPKGTKESAQLRKVGVAGAAGELQNAFADLRRGSGALVIGSASGRESAIESPLFGNGAFTYALLEGMGKLRADGNKSGTVEVSELRDYVIRRVRALTRDSQTPTVNRDNLQLDYAVAW